MEILPNEIVNDILPISTHDSNISPVYYYVIVDIGIAHNVAILVV